jgi:hypothetical protein
VELGEVAREREPARGGGRSGGGDSFVRRGISRRRTCGVVVDGGARGAVEVGRPGDAARGAAPAFGTGDEDAGAREGRRRCCRHSRRRLFDLQTLVQGPECTLGEVAHRGSGRRGRVIEVVWMTYKEGAPAAGEKRGEEGEKGAVCHLPRSLRLTATSDGGQAVVDNWRRRVCISTGSEGQVLWSEGCADMARSSRGRMARPLGVIAVGGHDERRMLRRSVVSP